MTLRIVSLPDHAHGSKEEDNKQLEHEYLEQHLVHELHDIADLGRLRLRVHHDLCLVAKVHWDTIYVISVPKGRPSQAQLLNAYSQYFWELRRLNVGIPLLKVLVRGIAVDLPIEVEDVFLGYLLDLGHRPLLFKTRFSIEVESVDICDAAVLGALQYEHVRGELGILVHLDELTRLKVDPSAGHPLLPHVVVDFGRAIIDFRVLPVAGEILF